MNISEHKLLRDTLSSLTTKCRSSGHNALRVQPASPPTLVVFRTSECGAVVPPRSEDQ